MRRVWAVLFVLLTVGIAWYAFSGDTLRDAVNAQWPPATPDQQRQTAIDSAVAALNAMTDPNVAAGTDLKTIEAIANEEVKGKGVTKLTLETDRDLLKVTAAFDTTLKPEDVDDAQKKEWIQKLRPHVVGRLEIFLAASALMVTTPKRVLQVKLLPAFKLIHVEKITLADSYDISAAGALLAGLLTSYADNITGALADDPILNAELPASIQDQFDPSGPIKIATAAGSGFNLSLSSKPVSSPYSLGAAALLIDGGEITVLAEISPIDKLPPPGMALGKAFSELTSAFKAQISGGLGLQSLPEGVWASVGKGLLASTFNSAFVQSQACLNGSGLIPKQTFDQKIPTPDPASIDCTPKMDCTPTQACDLQVDAQNCRRPPQCTHNHDTKDCHGLGKIPCELAKASQNQAYDRAFDLCNAGAWIDDQACEAQKATQNGLYAGQKAQCEADKSAAKFTCEAGKTGLKAACESLKSAVDALHQTGNVGNLNGSASGTGDLRICLREVTFAADLTRLSMKLETTGSAGLDTSFKFTPLDIAGHVLCQFPWTAEKHIDVAIPSQTIGIDLSLAKAVDSSEYKGQLKATPIKLHFEPSPLALILQNINFHLACPVTAELINGMTLDLAPFIPEVLKDYTHTLDPIDFSFVPNIPEQPLFGHAIKPKLSDTPKALVVSGAFAR
ncbi:hypothetical protein ACCS54_18940 [Rhizobium johnstonii]|uniref:hypothetical protein n=1 Tax=Rhizobium johnstonii TaxID=3019933 RepID=UPI003F990F0B